MLKWSCIYLENQKGLIELLKSQNLKEYSILKVFLTAGFIAINY